MRYARARSSFYNVDSSLKSISVDGGTRLIDGIDHTFFRVVWTETGDLIYQSSMVPGTNNIGEFFAIVKGLSLILESGRKDLFLYSDSLIALQWASLKVCPTSLPLNKDTLQTHKMIKECLAYLKNTEEDYEHLLKKWPTHKKGNIPADKNWIKA